MLNREFMIAEIRKHKDKHKQPYSRVKTKNGEMDLDLAPDKNIYGFYCKLLTGRKGKINTIKI